MVVRSKQARADFLNTECEIEKDAHKEQLEEAISSTDVPAAPGE